MEERMDLVYRLLDDQLLDADGLRCGRVDDIELEGELGGPLRLTGLLSGRGAYTARLPRRVRGWAEKLFGTDVRGETVRRIPWEEVEEIDTTVHLKRKAHELGLGGGDLYMRPYIERLPGS